MPKKSYTKTGKVCRVTFKLPAEVGAEKAAVAGEFNEWDATANPMKQLKDGSFSATVSLPTENTYRYRFLLDGARWENDWEAEEYSANAFGGDDSIITV